MTVISFSAMPILTAEVLKALEFVNVAMMNSMQQYVETADAIKLKKPTNFEEANDNLIKISVCNGYVKAVGEMVQVCQAIIDRHLDQSPQQ